MRVLLDTHTTIWFVQDDPRLSPVARQTLRLYSTVAYVSIVSLWEIALKSNQSKLRLKRSLAALIDEELVENGIEPLPISRDHLLRLERLPTPTNGHADPFDRMIVAQAMAEGLELLSADAKLDAYGVQRVW